MTPAGRTVALIGAPNCGKSTLFNRLTGTSQRTGNFPGVTVERKEGQYREADGGRVTLVDLPGLYSLSVFDDDDSLDQAVAREYLLASEVDLIVNVVDAGKLEQSLYLTVQLLEMGRPLVLAVNMVDSARRAGVEIDTDILAAELGCPVVALVAARNQGVDDLRAAITETARCVRAGTPVAYEPEVEDMVTGLMPAVNASARRTGISPRWLAVKALENDALSHQALDADARAAVAEAQAAVAEHTGEDAETLIADGRFGIAHRLAQGTTRHLASRGGRRSDRIDRLVLHRWLGVPIFLAVMYLMFTFTINVGGAFIDFFDIAAGALFVDGVGAIMADLGAPAWLRVIVADGIGGGIQVVATFIPVVAALFLFLTFLEDTGYMARAAFLMDRFMGWIGLPGKAIVPLIVGFGCNVPAVMATRTLERHHDRILTAAMAPFMSCGARLAVYALFVAIFFPVGGQNVVFGLYLLGVAVAVLTALVLRHTVIRGEVSPFMLELPTYHLPRPRDLALHTWNRLRSFLVEAGQVIVVVVMVLNVLNSVGTDLSFGNEDSEASVLSAASRAVSPVFAPMGIQDDNWPAVVGIITGVFAKEAVVGTLDALYGDPGTGGDPAGLGEAFGAALATIPENFGALGSLLADPLDLGSIEGAGDGVSGAALDAMAHRFDGALGAFAYLVFVLLYIPCVAVLGAIYRELGSRWMGFVALWTTGMAYATATLTYQIGTFGRHPLASSLWIGGLLLALALVVVLMRRIGRRPRGLAAAE